MTPPEGTPPEHPDEAGDAAAGPPDQGAPQPPQQQPPQAPEVPPAAEPSAAQPAASAPPPEAPTGEAPPTGGRHIHLPDHDPGFFGTLKAMKIVLSQLGRRKVAAATFTVAGIGFGLVMIFSGFSFWWTSQPDFCAKCHPMQKFVDAWEESPHAEVNCEECHLTPGLFGFIGGKIAGLQVVMNYVRGNYEDYSFNAAVGNGACLKCHEGIMEHTIHSKDTGIDVSHKDIIESGGKCMSCHSTIAHGEAVPVGSQTHPSMATCLQCHNDQIAPLDCDLCHVGKKPATVPPDMPASGPLPSSVPAPSTVPEHTTVPTASP